MTNPLGALASVRAVEPLSIPEFTNGGRSSGFASVFQNAMAGVAGAQASAQQQIGSFLNGEGAELHNVVMAAQHAELSFEMFQSVRNKIVQAYREVMRTQL